ncbi:TPA_asm: hypothetical protein HUJ06_031994 [Nelumbo nucifera]|uniref:Uncharacterized protein n=1 Tax=Nelumbo nucifera TaxID=4432 RepID=A0A822ZVH2_NELNU|nr:TPA_asm: hypothetical protein HUJ06_031994 [Nelumbo nucifera]
MEKTCSELINGVNSSKTSSEKKKDGV